MALALVGLPVMNVVAVRLLLWDRKEATGQAVKAGARITSSMLTSNDKNIKMRLLSRLPRRINVEWILRSLGRVAVHNCHPRSYKKEDSKGTTQRCAAQHRIFQRSAQRRRSGPMVSNSEHSGTEPATDTCPNVVFRGFQLRDYTENTTYEYFRLVVLSKGALPCLRNDVASDSVVHLSGKYGSRVVYSNPAHI